MPLRNVTFELNDFGGRIFGTLSSPDLYRTVAFEYQECRDNIILCDAREDEGKYKTPLAWLHPEDKPEIFDTIDKRIKEYLKIMWEAQHGKS